MPAKKKPEEEPLVPPASTPEHETPAADAPEPESVDLSEADPTPTPDPEPAAPAAATLELKLEPGQVIFAVTEKIANLAHEGRSYPVVNGRIILPATERWYDDLVQAGILKLP